MRSTICASSLNTRPWSPSNTAFVKLSRSGRRQGTQGHGSAFVGREGRDLGLGRTKVSFNTIGPSNGWRQCWRATAATVATQFSVSRSRRIPTCPPSRTAFSRCTRQGPPIQKCLGAHLSRLALACAHLACAAAFCACRRSMLSTVIAVHPSFVGLGARSSWRLWRRW